MKRYLVNIVLMTLLLLASCDAQKVEQKSEQKSNIRTIANTSAKVTFVELGSVNCIPCKQMQAIMKSIEKKYGSQINVIFYDVWKPNQKKYATQYGIKLIPTQVFLDKNGKEFHRHEGFYPEEEIDKILTAHGIKQKI